MLVGVEKVRLEGDRLWRQHHLIGAPRLGASQQHLLEHLALQRDEARPAGADVAKLADRVDDVAVEEGVVLQRRVAARDAVAVLAVVLELAALAVADAAVGALGLADGGSSTGV